MYKDEKVIRLIKLHLKVVNARLKLWSHASFSFPAHYQLPWIAVSIDVLEEGFFLEAYFFSIQELTRHSLVSISARPSALPKTTI